MSTQQARKLNTSPDFHVAPKKAAKSTVSSRNESLLGRYFQEVSAYPTIKPEEEIAISKRIENLEIALWAQLFSHTGLLEPILTTASRTVELETREVTALKRSAANLRKRSTSTARVRYHKLCDAVATQVRMQDVDCDALDLVLATLKQIESGKRRRVSSKRIAIKINSKSFRTYYKRVMELKRASQKVRNEFVQANLRLVVTIANRFNFGHLPLNDLIQEGNIGLIKAIGRFDHERGYRFSTYASWWIRHAITRAIADKGRTVRVPVHLQTTYKKVCRIRQELGSKLNRVPTTKEISSCSDLPADKVEEIKNQMFLQAVSLDEPLNDEDDRCLLDMINDPSQSLPDEPIQNEECYQHVLQTLSELSSKESDVVRRRFGMIDGRIHTLREIGKDYSLSRERIRQIQEKAIQKVRRSLIRQKVI